MNKADTFDHIESEVAVIGMSGRFPGARNIDQFWDNLCGGVEAISFFSEQELLSAGVGADLLGRPDYVRAGGALDGVEMFDASFFGFSRREAETTDPQQRLFLEHAWEALENAGYDSETYEGRIGVYAGVGMNLYLLDNIYSNREVIQSRGKLQTIIQNDKDFIATRVSYKLNLKGPSVVVQSACSTSLLAVHLACQSLLNGESDMVMAGGVAIRFLKKSGYLYQEGGIASPDGHCRAFDAGARGTVGGDGVGIVVLKRLQDALADGDSILAVIKGSAINNDGSSKVGYTAPSIDGQAQVIAEAQALAGVDADSISYVEAHGTATPMGDPIEVEALTKAFRATTDRKRFCAIGSVKTNVGHLDTAAGVTGLIKTVLALRHKIIPPSLHFERPNPEIDFENSPFYVNAALAEWEAGPTPRRAGVSSFGIGGTNVHVILEEAPVARAQTAGRSHNLLVLSAKTAPALEAMTANLARYLKQNAGANLADVAYTLQAGRRRFEHRRAIVAPDISTAVRALEGGDARMVKTRAVQQTNAPVVFMFPGQGGQYEGMGRELYKTEPKYREQIDLCSRLLKPHAGFDLRDLLHPEEGQREQAAASLIQTRVTQPAMFAVEYALAKLWMEWGVRPVAMIGHSLGEYVAACLAGVFTLEEALYLVAVRGRLIQQLPEGAMLAVPLSEQELMPMLSGALSLAAVNAPSRSVVSGPTDAIESLSRELESAGVDSRLLHTSHAFHSEMMEPMLAEFAEAFKSVKPAAPEIPYISNVTGKWITPQEATSAGYWLAHLRRPVRFSEGVAELLKEPDRILLEVGPGNTLTALAHQQKGNVSGRTILASMRHPRETQSDDAFILTTLGELWLAGARIGWDRVHREQRPRRVALPSYPFERKRYWIDPASAKKSVEGVASAPPASSETKGEAAPAARIERILRGQISVMSEQLDLLRKATARGRSGRAAIKGAVALTPVQQWFFEQNQPSPHHWNHSALLKIDPPADPRLLAGAFKELLAHHDSLRLRFARVGGGMRQLSASPGEAVPFTVVDLSGVPDEHIAQAIESNAAGLQSSLDLSNGPIARAAFFDLGGRRAGRLLLVIHHLAVDLFSWRVLLEDFEMAYSQMSRGGKVRLPARTTSFIEWAERLARYAQSDKLRREAAYWISTSRSEASVVPIDYAAGINTVGSARTLTLSLSEEETRDLLDRSHRSYRTQVTTLLMAALGAGFARWTGGRETLVDLEGHGREAIFDDVNLSRTVGWLTSIYPVLLEAGADEEPASTLERVRQQIKRVPDGGIGFGLLRYLTEDARTADRVRALPRSSVCFNYWGSFDRLPSGPGRLLPAGESAGPDQSLNSIRPYLIDVNGVIRKGRLRMEWTYSENIHRRSSIEEVAGHSLDALKSFCGMRFKAIAN